MSAHNILSSLSQEDLRMIAIVLAITWLLMIINQRVIPKIAERFSGKRRFQILSLLPIFRLIIILFPFVVLIPIVFSPSRESFIAFLGASGLALGFAFRDYINSIIAGIISLFETPYRPGDWIEIDGIYGEVKSIGLRSLTISTPDDKIVHIPQSKIWNTPIYNANSGKRELMTVTSFYLHPNHDPDQVMRTLQDIAITSAYTQLTHPIKVSAREETWGTQYNIKSYPIDARDQFNYKTDLTIRGKKALREIGIEFASIYL